MVFIGTVESVTPPFLTRWKPGSQEEIDRVNRVHEQYLSDRSPKTFALLKDALRTAFPGLPEGDRQRLADAASGAALTKLLTSVLDGIRSVHFRVRTVFRKEEDDNKKADDDDDSAKAPKDLDVVTPFGDCGYDFQVGETYLVYATDDEETNVLETNTCTRTRRVSDAGGDLAYLYFNKDRKNPSGRLQGFTTFDRLYQVQLRDPDRIPAPAEGVTIELKSDVWTRYTTSNALGQFVFDGLEEGSYRVTPYPAKFPEVQNPLAPTRTFQMAARGCATQVLIIPQ
jgi:hypothetical protein